MVIFWPNAIYVLVYRSHMLFNLQFARHCMCTTVTRAITLMQFPNCITTYGQLTEIGPNDGIKSKGWH